MHNAEISGLIEINILINEERLNTFNVHNTEVTDIPCLKHLEIMNKNLIFGAVFFSYTTNCIHDGVYCGRRGG